MQRHIMAMRGPADARQVRSIPEAGPEVWRSRLTGLWMDLETRLVDSYAAYFGPGTGSAGDRLMIASALARRGAGLSTSSEHQSGSRRATTPCAPSERIHLGSAIQYLLIFCRS